MKESNDNKVVSLIEFRNKRIKSLFNGEDIQTLPTKDILDHDFPSIQDWVTSLKDMLDNPEEEDMFPWQDPGDPDLTCAERDASISDDDVERLDTILSVVDDALQSLYHAHATITSDKLWVRAEAIQRQIAAMKEWAEYERQQRD